MKKMLKVLLVLMTVVSIAGCSSKTTTEKATKKTKTLSGNYQVEIKVKDYGTIYAEIDADTAPITVTNFVKLSKEKYESLVNIIPEGIYIANFDNNNITYANSRFLEMTNYKTVEEIDMDNISNSMIITTSKDDENIKFQRRTVKSGQKDMHIECGGTIIEVNKKLNVVGIVRDITKQVKAELMEIEIEKQKIANKIKSEFFINMSHELKTPLNVISSSNQLMSILHKENIKLNPDSQLSNTVKIIKKNADILMEIINNIMDLSKLELKV